MSSSYSRVQRGPMAGDRFTQISNALFRDKRISLKAKGLFGLISTHRDGYGLTIEAILRDSKDGRDAVRSALAELEKYGYLERIQQHDDEGKFAGVVYCITDMPAHLYELFGEDAPQLPSRSKARSACSAPMSGNPAADKPAAENPHPKKTTTKNTKTEEQQKDDAPSARSAGDARRASTGSGAGARGGSAATEKRAPSRKKTRLTRDEAAAVAVVERAIPESLLELLDGKQVPHNFRIAAARELANRTAEQLADRMARRWVRHRFQSDLLAGKGIGNPYAALQALVRPGECPDAGCEDGELVDTGADCRTCEERRANRRGRNGSVPSQRTGRSWWECRICRDPKPHEPEPEDRECRDCKREAAIACETLAARWNAPTTEDVNDR